MSPKNKTVSGWRRVMKWIKWTVVLTVSLLVLLAAFNWTQVQRLFLGGLKVYETSPPSLPSSLNRPAVLVFSKTNSFRHEAAILASNRLFERITRDAGLGYFQTENGAAFSAEVLSQFDVVIFNNVTGDVLTSEQKQAFQRWLRNGGSYLGIHGAGDRSHHRWGWYTDSVIGARFVEKTVYPPVQTATLKVTDDSHPIVEGLPATWRHADEWYSFDRSVRERGRQVLITVDETTYNPQGLFGEDIRMGADHPVAWVHCEGRGRVFYTALGHRAEAFGTPEVATLLANAVRWTTTSAINECKDR